MPKRRSDPARHRPTDPDELLGFLSGIQHRLALRRQSGFPERGWESKTRIAQANAEKGAWSEAERMMREVDAHLRATEPESELKEFPRGLVGYVPRGDRGAAPSTDEDPLKNRIDLASRLLEVRRGQGHDISLAQAELGDAERAMRSGDRRRARERCDAAFTAIERMDERKAQG